MHRGDKFSVTQKPLNKYLGDFVEDDKVPTSKCPETKD